ncbi:MAG: hypothetical protein ABL903_01670 [Methylococcales bacterium]
MFITLLLLTITEHKAFLDVAFEVVYAKYGTVELSLGFILATPKKAGISYANTQI